MAAYVTCPLLLVAGASWRPAARPGAAPDVQGARLPDALGDEARHLATAEMRGSPTPASRELRAIPGVRNFGSHIGQAFLAEEVAASNFAENWISVDPNADYDADRRRDPGGRRRLPGPATRRADVPASERINEVLTGAGDQHRGPDLRAGPRRAPRQGATRSSQRWPASRRGRRSRRAAGRRAADPGHGRPPGGRSATASSRVTSAAPPRRSSPARRSATSSATARPTTSWSGAHPQSRGSLDRHPRTCCIDTPAGQRASQRCRRRADLGPATPNEIEHEDGSRRIDVAANVRGRDLGLGRRRTSSDG